MPATVRVLMDTPPNCRDASITAISGQPFVIDDLPCDDFDDDLLTIYVDDPAHGTIAFPDDGSVVYTPTAGYVGPDSFTYYAEEDEFGLQSPFDATMEHHGHARAGSGGDADPGGQAPGQCPGSCPGIWRHRWSRSRTRPRSRRSRITLSTSENATATLTLTLDKATARKLHLGRTVGGR